MLVQEGVLAERVVQGRHPAGACPVGERVALERVVALGLLSLVVEPAALGVAPEQQRPVGERVAPAVAEVRPCPVGVPVVALEQPLELARPCRVGARVALERELGLARPYRAVEPVVRGRPYRAVVAQVDLVGPLEAAPGAACLGVVVLSRTLKRRDSKEKRS